MFAGFLCISFNLFHSKDEPRCHFVGIGPKFAEGFDKFFFKPDEIFWVAVNELHYTFLVGARKN